MTTNTPHAVTGFTRCAVCKIDLKGRFVYIDERTEKLFGYATEDLLGRPLPDYITAESQALVARLLEQRNHYELFFDTASMTVVTSDGNRIPITVIASLNFIGGNPVNFQLIMHPEDTEVSTPQASVADSNYPRVISELLAIEDTNDWKQVLTTLVPFCSARQGAVYVIQQDRLEPRSVVGQTTDSEFESQSLPETNILHVRVASTGEAYSNLDELAVEKAIETTGEAPTEFVTRVDTPGQEPALLRLIFDNATSEFDMRQGTERARLLLSLLQRIRASRESEEIGNIDDSIKFTIGFLDSLEVGALLTERTGKILGFNPTLARWLGDNRPDGTFHNFGQLLRAADGENLVGLFQDYFNSPLDPESPLDLKLPVRLPDNSTADLTVVRLSFDSDDRSACFALVPHRAPAMPEAASSAAGDEQFWIDAVHHLRTAVTEAGSASAEIDQQPADQHDESTASVKSRLDLNLTHARDMLADLDSMLAVTTGPKQAEEVDLSTTIEKAMNRLREAYPKAHLSCRFDSLPTIKTDARKIETVFAQLMNAAV
ncbi:PAS domain-containing protein, partial [candidate division GN15 bacterium]|nr:PAS domain-containing protein [candidate division GN15 bacterium]